MNENWRNLDDNGQYTRTYSLTKVHFLDPKPNEIKIDDIAYHLAKSGRYNHGIDPHYSVAEHSILMANWFLERNERELAQQSLVHDTPEYLFGDVPAPLKRLLPDYNKWEDTFEAFLLPILGVNYPLDHRVKELDRRICATEQIVLRKNESPSYHDMALNDIHFHLWHWQTAKSEFLLMFHTLFPDYKDA